jgi:hypothetical protein
MAIADNFELSESVFERGEIEVLGRLVDASNATLFGKLFFSGQEIPIVYKPIAGERPLWDFKVGTLAFREVAAYRFSRIVGLELVPITVLRDGPFGVGAVQQWIEVDEGIDLIAMAQSDDLRLRKMALLDALINNTDRKFGHILIDASGALFGCDHGVTFHREPKLRTVIWQFAGTPFDKGERELLEKLQQDFSVVTKALESLLSEDELSALLQRTHGLLKKGVFPYPSEEWPAVPWPPY